MKQCLSFLYKFNVYIFVNSPSDSYYYEDVHIYKWLIDGFFFINIDNGHHHALTHLL